MLLAAAMTEDAEGFVRGLMATNLALAGRAAALPGLSGRLGESLLDELRWALVARSRDGDADLRARIAAGHAVGELGDPRFKRRSGLYGEYLLPPMVEVPGGLYPIGDDGPIAYDAYGLKGATSAHVPRHTVAVAPFRVGRFLVTNAEYARFLEGGGYQDERWWETTDSRRWLRGAMPNEAAMMNNRHFRARFLSDPTLFQRMEDEGGFLNAAVLERWRRWVAMDEASFEAELAERWKGARQVQPALWRDERLNDPAQPVVGVTWYEARAYAAWLSAQTGEAYRLLTEVQWEATSRGRSARAYAWGDAYAPECSNTFETLLRRTSPVGVFVEGDTPEGLSDLSGNTLEWTLSLFGEMKNAVDEMPEFTYPYHADDGREDVAAPPAVARMVRGGAFDSPHADARTAYRFRLLPLLRDRNLGFRLAASSL